MFSLILRENSLNSNKVKVIKILPKSDEQNHLITELGIKFNVNIN